MTRSIPFIVFVCLLFIGCDTANFSETSGEDLFFLQNEKAIMPIRVQGNKASDKFVIFLHGGPGGNIVDARDYLGASMGPIEEQVAMVYWDQRCAGSSQGNCDRKELSFESYNADIAKLVILLEDQYGKDIKLYFMTHSFGGWLATVYLSASNNQNRFSGWINVDGSYNASLLFEATKDMITTVGNRQIGLGQNKDKWQKMINEINLLDLSFLEDQGILNGFAYDAPALMTDVDSVNVTQYSASLSTVFTSPGSLLANLTNNLITEASPFNSEVFQSNDSDKLANINLPVLLLWGKYDFVVPSATIDDFKAHIGSTEVSSVIFERSEHTPFVTEPAKFAEVVAGFFDRF